MVKEDEDGSNCEAYDPCAGKSEGLICKLCSPLNKACREASGIKTCQSGVCKSQQAYVKAGGAQNCPVGTMVDAKDECEIAGPALGYPFKKVVSTDVPEGGTGQARPAGCFWDKSGGSYYNTVLTAWAGKWGGVGAICKAPTPEPTPEPTTPVPTYITGSVSTNTCPQGSTEIGSSDECNAAGVSLGLSFRDSLNSDSEPGGCYRNKHGRTRYNSAEGNSKEGNTPICKQAGR